MEIENIYFWREFETLTDFNQTYYDNMLNEYIKAIYSNDILNSVMIIKELTFYCYRFNVTKENILNDVYNMTSKIEVIYFTKGVLSAI